MSATGAITGKGTTLGYGTSSSGPFTSLSELTEANTPEHNIGNVEATHYTSDNNTIEKLSVVWEDISDLPLQLNYLKAQTTTLYAMKGVAKWWMITKPDGSTYVFPGFIAKLGGNPIPNKDKISQSATITVTGPVTFTAGS